MKLNLLSDDELLSQTRALAAQERSLQAKVLQFIREIHVRKLYLKRGYPSLFAFLTRELHYSAGAAHRRMEAARLLQDVPEVLEKIQTGEMNLMSLTKAQAVFRTEGKRRGTDLPAQEKAQALREITHGSADQVLRDLSVRYPEAVKATETSNKSTLRSMDRELSRLTVIIPDDLREMLLRLREIHGHRLPSGEWVDLLRFLCADSIKRHDPLKKAQRVQAKSTFSSEGNRKFARSSSPDFKSHNQESSKTQKLDSGKNDISAPLAVSPPQGQPGEGPNVGMNASPLEGKSEPQSVSTVEMKPEKEMPRIRPHRENIPARTRQLVILRDQGRCQFKDFLTGRRCLSRVRVEIDHIQPVALGGGNEVGNLRCLCRAHNQNRVMPENIQRPRFVASHSSAIKA